MQSNKKKRKLDEDSDHRTDVSSGSQSTFACDEMSSCPIPPTTPDHASSISTSTYITVHHVECSGVGRYHENHELGATYFQVPFLPALSNRLTRLRGEDQLVDLESYIEDQVNLSFVVYMTYDCVAYHEEIKASFERLPMPQLDNAITQHTEPYFYVLRQDAGPAKPHSESLIPSKVLRKALEMLRGSSEDASDKERRGESKYPRSYVYPYLDLYHRRQIFAKHSRSERTAAEQGHLTVLSNFLKSHLDLEYTEAEELSKHGTVKKKHWEKLFRPGGVVVSKKSNEPAAYVSVSCTIADDDSLHLKCWSWAFETEFFKDEVELVVTWPSDKDTIAITDLLTYPLEHAPAGFEQELRRRGQVFWGCRSRKFVNYEVPSQGMEVQTVRPLNIDSVHKIANADRPTRGTW
jgi:hypothetical protein